ncbi:MAG: hypothetical protein IPO38_12520 [Rhodocyclaceae bacterium]|nr:hypothetical protein [Rhodocyclaceae bacterium]
MATPAHAQATNSKNQPKAAPPAATAPAQSPAVMVTQAFTQRGANKCAERVGQFSQFLTNGAQVGGQVFVAPEEGDRRLASASLEIQAGQAMAYAGLTFSPDSGANRCGGVYELVSYWPKTCEEVATKDYVTFKRTGPLRQTIIALDGGPTVRVFLMPAGAGCVSIKKELAY